MTLIYGLRRAKLQSVTVGYSLDQKPETRAQSGKPPISYSVTVFTVFSQHYRGYIGGIHKAIQALIIPCVCVFLV